MNQNFRGCLYRDHQYNQVQYYCSYPQCQMSKLLCSECFEEQLHNHNLPNNNHILNKRKFIEFINKTIQNQCFYEANVLIADIEQTIQGIQKHLLQIINIIKIQKEQQYNYEKRIQILQSYTIENCFNNLDDNLLQQYNAVEHQQLIRPINQIYQLSQKLNNLVRSIDLPIIVETQQIEEQDNYNLIIACQISNDCKYLVYGGTNQQLNIWDIDLKKLVLSIRQEQYINICRFTDDSSQLFVGQGLGYLSQYNLKDKFQQVYFKKIDESGILNILTTNEYIYATTSEKMFIKMNINTKQLLFKIQAHQQRIDGICYDQQEKTLITCSADLSIKAWDQNGILMINHPNAHQNKINQIQISKNLLLSLDTNNQIYIWQINFQTKSITKSKEIFDNNGIFNFSIILSKYLLIVSKQVINIYDISSLVLIKQYEHNISDLFMYKTVQQNNLQAVVVKGKKSIKIFAPI